MEEGKVNKYKESEPIEMQTQISFWQSMTIDHRPDLQTLNE